MPSANPASALTPAGIARTQDEDGAAYLLPVPAELELCGEPTCNSRDAVVW